MATGSNLGNTLNMIKKEDHRRALGLRNSMGKNPALNLSLSEFHPDTHYV